MGTASAWILAQHPDCQVRLWGRNPDYVRQLAETRENTRLLPGARLPQSILVTASAPAALESADVVFWCMPMRGLRDALQQLGPAIPPQSLHVSTIKSIENDSLLRPTEILAAMLPGRRIAALGGPCHAEEIVRRKPASIVAASTDPGAAEQIQALMSTEFLRIYANTDLAGVELAAALKNVIAIAAGICDGLELGDNAKAALITRGLSEMVRFGKALGVLPATFFGLAGLGDLITTCNSRHSRNRYVGEQLGRGERLEAIERSMAAVAEGVSTARSVHQLARQRGIEMPIADQVYHVLFAGRSPREATLELMNRPLKFESSYT
ncbi:MAG: Glycerol-3-phosphate dehydrogenase [Planctomycetota bacterium]|jgi:glycerol-3-phosphate dehydrogenase (NAD(P)+)